MGRRVKHDDKIIELIHEHKELSGADLLELDKSFPVKSIYTILTRLQKNGLLSSRQEKIPGERNRPRRYYKLTDKGINNLISTKKRNRIWWFLSDDTETPKLDTTAPNYPYKRPEQREYVISILELNLQELEAVVIFRTPFDFKERLIQLHKDFERSLPDIFKLSKTIKTETLNKWTSKAISDLPDEYKKHILYQYVWEYFRDEPRLLKFLKAPLSVVSKDEQPEPGIPLMDENPIETISRYVTYIFDLRKQLPTNRFVLSANSKNPISQITLSNETENKTVDLLKIEKEMKISADYFPEDLRGPIPPKLRDLLVQITINYFLEKLSIEDVLSGHKKNLVTKTERTPSQPKPNKGRLN